MEPQVNINCMNKRNSCRSLTLVIWIFVLVLAFAVGVLIGGVTGLFATIGLGAFIVLITLLVVAIIALIVYYFSRGCRRT